MNKTPMRAPEFPDHLEWLNTESPLRLATQRGKVVLLYFWTYSSIECMRMLPDLRYLQGRFPEGLTIIGIHAPKFPHEQSRTQVQKAINRLHIQHPVALDADLKLWEQFRIKSWPTLIYIDPVGDIVGVLRGEGKRKKLEQAITKDLEKAEAAGVRNPGRVPLQSRREAGSRLRFPGKLLATQGRLYISDSGRNRVLEADPAGGLRRVFGSGSPGLVDGQGETASFDNPQGLVKINEDLFVADAGNHALRRIRLDTGDVETVAGIGEPARPGAAEIGNPLTARLNFPWDLARHHDTLFIAMAGQHQIWQYQLNSKKLGILAGSGTPGFEDGPARTASFAQPSGLAVLSDHLFIADANASAIRVIRLQNNAVATVVGQGMQQSGDLDGIGREARLQYPLAIVADPKRELLWIADAFNNKLKTVSFRDNRVRTLEIEHILDEPAGLSLIGDSLFVANTNAHEILRLNISTRAVEVIDIDELG